MIWPDGKRWESVANLGIPGVLVAVGSLVAFFWGVHWALLPGLAVGAALVLWGALTPLAQVELTESALVKNFRGKRRELPLQAISEVKTEWVPYGDPDIVFSARGKQIKFRLSDSTKPFVASVGSALAPRMNSVRASQPATEALGWPDRPGLRLALLPWLNG